MLLLLIALLLPSVEACATDIGGTFTLKRLSKEIWQAGYCIDVPVNAIQFSRSVEKLRQIAWDSNDPEFELVHKNGLTQMQRKDGQIFECTSLKINQYTELPKANYYAFSSFSDAGVSVYTGYFLGQVLINNEWHNIRLKAEYKGRNKENIITREPDFLVEQFVYFGPQGSQNKAGVIPVIDPAIPSEAKRNILQTVSAVSAMLTAEVKFNQKNPYRIYIASDFDAFDGYSIKGGALPNQILFTVKGREAKAKLIEDPGFLSKLTAHEVIHLWQEEQWFGTLGNDRPWIHEGSAEALATELMHRTGIYDRTQYIDAWKSTEQNCLTYMEQTSINNAPENSMFDAVYPCGALVNRIVGEAINPKDFGHGIIRFWLEMAKWEDSTRKIPSEKLLFRTLEKLGFSKKKRNLLHQFLASKTDNPKHMLDKLRQELR